MTPWKSSKYLHPMKDYDSYEFYSPVNPQAVQQQYSRDFQKTKFIEFDVFPGYVLFVPPYWWYSINFSDGSKDVICSITYSTIMNIVSNSPDLFLHWLQQQNINQKVSKTKEETKKEEVEEEETKEEEKEDQGEKTKEEEPKNEVIL
jgi:hypothetical protein